MYSYSTLDFRPSFVIWLQILVSPDFAPNIPPCASLVTSQSSIFSITIWHHLIATYRLKIVWRDTSGGADWLRWLRIISCIENSVPSQISFQVHRKICLFIFSFSSNLCSLLSISLISNNVVCVQVYSVFVFLNFRSMALNCIAFQY